MDHIPRAVKGNVEEVLKQKDGRGQREHLQKVLELEQVLDRDVEHLSGTASCTAWAMSRLWQNAYISNKLPIIQPAALHLALNGQTAHQQNIHAWDKHMPWMPSSQSAERFTGLLDANDQGGMLLLHIKWRVAGNLIGKCLSEAQHRVWLCSNVIALIQGCKATCSCSLCICLLCRTKHLLDKLMFILLNL